MTDADSEYHSRYYSTRFAPESGRELVWREICAYLQPRDIPENGVVLEIGAGYGDFINQIRGRERHALDLSPGLVQRVAPGVLAHVGSCTSLPMFADGSVDVVFASNLFEHLTREELSSALREISRVLRPGGRLVVVQPNFKYCPAEYFDDYTHLQVFTHVSLTDRLMADGFGILRVVPRFLPFSMKSRLPKSRLLVRLYLRSPFKPFGAQMLVVAQVPQVPQVPHVAHKEARKA